MKYLNSLLSFFKIIGLSKSFRGTWQGEPTINVLSQLSESSSLKISIVLNPSYSHSPNLCGHSKTPSYEIKIYDSEIVKICNGSPCNHHSTETSAVTFPLGSISDLLTYLMLCDGRDSIHCWMKQLQWAWTLHFATPRFWKGIY